MCLEVENYFSEVNEVLAPLELDSFLLDENHCLIHSPLQFPTQIFSMSRYSRKRDMLKYDVCEDG